MFAMRDNEQSRDTIQLMVDAYNRTMLHLRGSERGMSRVEKQRRSMQAALLVIQNDGASA